MPNPEARLYRAAEQSGIVANRPDPDPQELIEAIGDSLERRVLPYKDHVEGLNNSYDDMHAIRAAYLVGRPALADRIVTDNLETRTLDDERVPIRAALSADAASRDPETHEYAHRHWEIAEARTGKTLLYWTRLAILPVGAAVNRRLEDSEAAARLSTATMDLSHQVLESEYMEPHQALTVEELIKKWLTTDDEPDIIGRKNTLQRTVDRLGIGTKLAWGLYESIETLIDNDLEDPAIELLAGEQAEFAQHKDDGGSMSEDMVARVVAATRQALRLDIRIIPLEMHKYLVEMYAFSGRHRASQADQLRVLSRSALDLDDRGQALYWAQVAAEAEGYRAPSESVIGETLDRVREDAGDKAEEYVSAQEAQIKADQSRAQAHKERYIDRVGQLAENIRSGGTLPYVEEVDSLGSYVDMVTVLKALRERQKYSQ